MRRLLVLLVAPVLAGWPALPVTGGDDADDFHVPLVCLPKHTQLPCAHGVEQGIAYEFSLQTHCGIEWAYFDGRYWKPIEAEARPSHWANITVRTMVLERPSIAAFEATQGGGARFVPASASYRPPACL